MVTMRRTRTFLTFVSSFQTDFYIDIRMTKRNRKKFITTIEGIPEIFNLEKIKKALAKMTHSQAAVSESRTNKGQKIIQI